MNIVELTNHKPHTQMSTAAQRKEAAEKRRRVRNPKTGRKKTSIGLLISYNMPHTEKQPITVSVTS